MTATLTISTLSTEYVKVPLTVTVDGEKFDPTSEVVQMAFTEVGDAPGDDDWRDASWETIRFLPYARCLVGPDGTGPLMVGQWTVWVKVFSTHETPVLNCGQLEVDV